jgi:DNA polymerase III epsilon subunit-like protein
MNELTIRFSHVARLVQALGLPLTIFDLEATTFRGRSNFGITEVCAFTVTLQGNGVIHGHLIDPERTIDPKVVELTGITQAMVRGKETWGHRYAGLFKTLAKEAWVGGFNIKTFDCPAVLEMNERYGQPIEGGFRNILDVRQLYLDMEKPKSKKGKLVEIAEFYDIYPQGALHRAEGDVVLTLETLDAMVEGYGVEALVAVLKPTVEKATARGPASAGASGKPLAPATEVLIALANAGEHRTIAALAQALGVEERAVSFELGKAVDERRVNPLPFVNTATLEWLRQMLVELPTDTVASGRLKPIFEHLTERQPEGIALDYLQLRIAMMDCGLNWTTLKPSS